MGQSAINFPPDYVYLLSITFVLNCCRFVRCIYVVLMIWTVPPINFMYLLIYYYEVYENISTWIYIYRECVRSGPRFTKILAYVNFTFTHPFIKFRITKVSRKIVMTFVIRCFVNLMFKRKCDLRLRSIVQFFVKQSHDSQWSHKEYPYFYSVLLNSYI